MAHTFTRCLHTLAFAIAVTMASAKSSNAAFVGLPSPAPETPGIALDPDTSPLTGTVLATLNSPFVDNAMPSPFASGTLYSLVVDRGGGLLDFYYQLVNTTETLSDNTDETTEFFRIKTTGGFDPSLVISVAQTDSLSGLDAGNSGFDANQYRAGDKPAATADRDVATLGSIGFDFPTQPPLPFIGDPRNIAPDQASAYLVVRTDATQYRFVNVRISGAATSEAMAFAPAPVPEPATMPLFLVGFGIAGAITRRTTLLRKVSAMP